MNKEKLLRILYAMLAASESEPNASAYKDFMIAKIKAAIIEVSRPE